MSELSSLLLSFALWFSSLTSGGRWTYGSAFFVLVGVIGESIIDLTEWIKDSDLKKKIGKAQATTK